jgi:hypothetical protein
LKKRLLIATNQYDRLILLISCFEVNMLVGKMAALIICKEFIS